MKYKVKCKKHGRYLCCTCRYGTKKKEKHEESEIKDCVDFINEERYVEENEQCQRI